MGECITVGWREILELAFVLVLFVYTGIQVGMAIQRDKKQGQDERDRPTVTN